MRLLLLGTLMFGLIGLAGCSAEDASEIQQWMVEQRAQTKPRVTPIAEPKKFEPQAYSDDHSLDPFSQQKLTMALRSESPQSGGSNLLVTPELSRRKEPLEAYPLDAMAMVGSLMKGGQLVALVRVDNLLYQVRIGHHLGMNFGKVTKIEETQLNLREIVQDAAGEWIERVSTLQLQEGKK